MKSEKVTKQAVLNTLKKNRKGITRQELSRLTGATDRACRRAVSELRSDGHIIGTTASGGYSFGNKTDYKRTIAFLTAKARKEEEIIRAMNRTLGDINQVTTF